MSKCINSNSLATKFLSTYSTVNHVIVATFVYAIGISVVFYYNIPLGMSKCINLITNVAVATYGTSVGCVTALGTGRIGNYRFIIVTESGNDPRILSNLIFTLSIREELATINAGPVITISCLSTSCIISISLNKIVSNNKNTTG